MADDDTLYLCWCDGDPSCGGVTKVPFGLCDECAAFGHGRLPRHNLMPTDVEIEVEA